MEENRKDVLINVKVDNQDAITATEDLKRRYKQLTDQALEFDNIDYDNATIEDLKVHLQQADQVMSDLKDTGLATEQQIESLGQTSKQLKQNISSLKIDNVFKGMESSVMGVVGSAQLLQGAMNVIGIESDEANEQIAKMMSLMSIKDGIENLGKYAQGMKDIAFTTGGATKATSLLRIGLSGLGIGLIISLITYLTNNWDSLSKTVKEFIPELDGVSKYFEGLQPILEGVGKAIVGFVVRPIKSAIEAFQAVKKGDWQTVGKALIDAMNPISKIKGIVEDFKGGYAQGIVNANKKKNEDVKKDNEKANKDIVKQQNQLLESLKKEIENASKIISDANKTARQVELDDLNEHYDELIKQAEKHGLETASLIEVQRMKIAEINKRYDDAELKEAEEKARQASLQSAQTVGQTNVLNTETNNDPNTVEGMTAITNARLEALQMQYDAELVLYQDNEEKKLLLQAKYNNDVKNLQSDLTQFILDEQQKQLDDKQAKDDLALSSASALASGLGSLAKESTVLGKSLAVASAIINTYQGATKALAQGGVAGIITMGSVIAAGLASVKQILSTKVEGENGSTSSVAQPTFSAPIINTTQLQPRQTQDVRITEDNTTNSSAPVRAYIVNKDLETNDEKESFYNAVSTF